MACLEVGKARRWEETGAGSDGSDGTKKVKDMESWDRSRFKLGRGTCVEADCPIIHIDQRLKELLSEESPKIGLVESMP